MNVKSTEFRASLPPNSDGSSTSPSPTPVQSTRDRPLAPDATSSAPSAAPVDHNHTEFVQLLIQELQAETGGVSKSLRDVAQRIAVEVERICEKSDRIQQSGQVRSWQLTLARHRIQKCLAYHKLGSRRGRVELHSHLSAMVYRHIAPARTHMGFQGRYTLIEDFLQNFYIEVLKAFRRENQLSAEYSPRTRIELAEYMAFTEQYAKRRINLPGRRNQQLVVLRAQGFANRQPLETSVDMEAAIESGRSEEAEAYSRSPVVQQVREQMVAETTDPSDSVLRDRIIAELVEYLESQGQSECVDYLVLKLQDLSAPEIDEVLQLSPRQRDYLQQRFKYHVEKFARSHRWQLVHQWLGADLDQNLGMAQQNWDAFVDTLTPDQQHLLRLKQLKTPDQAIAQTLKCTTKQVHKRWVKLLDLAWQARNEAKS